MMENSIHEKGSPLSSGSSIEIQLLNDAFFYVTGSVIIVLKIQCSYDDIPASINNQRAFAIGTLLSSAQVYNLSKNSENVQLEFLRFIADYGNLLSSDDGNKIAKPFQNLTFFFENWVSLNTLHL